jgi:hypothetical protein
MQTLQVDTRLDAQFVTLSGFRSMVWLAIQDAQIALCQLMLGWEPALDLRAIQDSLVNRSSKLVVP